MVLALKSYDGGENWYQSSRGCSFIVLSLGEHGLAPDWQVCVLNESFAFVIVYRFARWRGFRPAGRLTFFSREKSKQKRLPLHTALRCAQGSFAPSPPPRPPYKRHPWPFPTLSASLPPALYATIPLTLLKGADGVACWIVQKEAKPKQHQKSFKRLGPHPPSGGRVEVLRRGTRGMDAERGAKGQGRPFVPAPGAAPERGESGHRPDPDVGRAFSLVTFSFARAKRK